MLQRLADDMARLDCGAPLTQPQVDALIQRWQPIVCPLPKHQEPFDLVTCDGETIGVIAPRWLCHLLGLCHRAVHLALRTPQDWLALQVHYEVDSVNPPVHSCHITQIFTATLTPVGLASLRFADGEVIGLYLASFDGVDRMTKETPDRLAPGLVQSWPHYVAASRG